MAVFTPWAFGGAPPAVIRSLTLTSLLISIGVLAGQVRARHVEALPTPLWPFFGIVALGGLQLVPLPPNVHRYLAPGSAEIWHPGDPVVAMVLGDGWRPISIHPAATRASAAWGLGLLGLASLSIPALRNRRTRRAVLAAVAAGALAVAVYGVVARVTLGPLLYGRLAVPTVAPFGPFVSKNHFAGYVAMAALVALGLALSLLDHHQRGSSGVPGTSGKRATATVFVFGASAALVLAVLVAQSRGAVLSLLVGLCAFWALRQGPPKTSRRALVVMVVSACVAGGMWSVLPLEARQRLGTLFGAPDASSAYRLGLWGDAVRTFAASPWLGQGLGTFVDALPRVKTVAAELLVEHAENDYLELLAEGGLAAGFMVLLALRILVWPLVVRRARRGPPGMSGEAAGAAAALAVVAVHSGFDFCLRLGTAAVLAALLLAVTLSASRDVRKAPAGQVTIALVAMVASLAVPDGHRASRRRLVDSPLTPIRLRLVADEWESRVRTRPADALAWAQLAWVRIREGRGHEAVALAHHAARLNPRRPGLGDYVERLSRAARPASYPSPP